MLKKVKKNKKLEIIQKINTFLAFCNVNSFEIKKIKKGEIDINFNIDSREIYIDKIKNYCFINIYFVDKITQQTLIRFILPNI